MAASLFFAFVFTRPFFNVSSAPLATLANDAGLLIVSTFIIISKRKEKAPLGPLTLPLLLWSAAIILSSLAGAGGSDGWTRAHHVLIGTLLFAVPFCLSSGEKMRLIRILFFAGVLAACLGLYQAAFGFKRVETLLGSYALIDPAVRDTLAARRIFYPFIGPNLLAGFLAMIAPLGLVKARRPWGLFPVLLALLLTRSIGAWTALFAGSLIVLLLTRRPTKKFFALLAAFTACLAAILMIRTNNPSVARHPLHSLFMRVEYWSDTLALIRQHPFLGTGLGSFDLPDARHAHNILIELWAEMGIAGPAAFLFLAGTVFKAALRRLSSPVTALLLTSATVHFIHNQIDVPFFFPETAFAGWLIAGLAAATALETRPGPLLKTPEDENNKDSPGPS